MLLNFINKNKLNKIYKSHKQNCSALYKFKLKKRLVNNLNSNRIYKK